jgi:hypothetical protein
MLFMKGNSKIIKLTAGDDKFMDSTRRRDDKFMMEMDILKDISTMESCMDKESTLMQMAKLKRDYGTLVNSSRQKTRNNQIAHRNLYQESLKNHLIAV